MIHFVLMLIEVVLVCVGYKPLMNKILRRLNVKSRLRKRVITNLIFLGTIVVIIYKGWFSWRQDCEGAARQNQLQADLNASRVVVESNQSLLLEQERTIGSLIFNIKTSEEGKRRFVGCFEDLSRMAEYRDRALRFEGLICDDGVAVFGFNRDALQLVEFFFFTNAEVNHVLSGVRLGDRFVDEGNVVQITSTNELGIIVGLMNEMLPQKSGHPIEQAKAQDRILERLETVLRYAYRAETVTMKWAQNTQGECCSLLVDFSYAANPLAVQKRMLSASLEFRMSELDSLYGLTTKNFNTRIIQKCYRVGIEPKVRARDVAGMNAAHIQKEQIETFPYKR